MRGSGSKEPQWKKASDVLKGGAKARNAKLKSILKQNYPDYSVWVQGTTVLISKGKPTGDTTQSTLAEVIFDSQFKDDSKWRILESSATRQGDDRDNATNWDAGW